MQIHRKNRILLGSCYRIIHEALNSNLSKQQDMEIIADTANSEEAIELAATLNPDLVILDIDMPTLNGIQTTERIKEVSPGTKVLLLTIDDNNEQVEKIKKAGANGYVNKKAPIDVMIRTVRSICSGQNVLPLIANPNLNFYGPTDNTAESSLKKHKLIKLTQKELIILRCVTRGDSNREIAQKLNLSLPNVKSTLNCTFTKLHVSSRTQAISVGLKSGILSLQDFR